MYNNINCTNIFFKSLVNLIAHMVFLSAHKGNINTNFSKSPNTGCMRSLSLSHGGKTKNRNIHCTKNYYSQIFETWHLSRMRHCMFSIKTCVLELKARTVQGWFDYSTSQQEVEVSGRTVIPTKVLGCDESSSPPSDLLFGIPMCTIVCFGNSVVLPPLLQNRFLTPPEFPFVQKAFLALTFLCNLCFGPQSVQSLSLLILSNNPLDLLKKAEFIVYF